MYLFIFILQSPQNDRPGTFFARIGAEYRPGRGALPSVCAAEGTIVTKRTAGFLCAFLSYYLYEIY